MLGKNNLVNIQRLQKKFDEIDLDAFVSTTMGNFYYLTGFTCDGLVNFPYDHQSYAVIARDEPTKPYIITSQGLSNQVLDGFEEIQGVATYGKFFRPGPFGSYGMSEDDCYLRKISVENPPCDDPLKALIQILRKFGLTKAKIGIDEINLKRGYFEDLQKELPFANFILASDLFRDIRKVKTDEEVKLLQKVSRINENAIRAMLAIACEGITEHEMACEFQRSVISQGAEVVFTNVRFGPGGVSAERKPGKTRLKPGEAIFIDVGCRNQGYYADFGRTACLGEPSERLLEVYNHLLNGHRLAFDQLRPGMTAGELFEISVNGTKVSGLSHYERHHTGHGIGAELYENPMITPNNDDTLDTGTVVNCESPYYEFGLGGLIVEDPIYVGKSGNTLLTTISQELIFINN